MGRNNDDLSNKQNGFDKEVKGWVAQQLGGTPPEFEKIFKRQSVMLYLLVWPIFETKLFATNMKGEKIEFTAKKFSEYYNELDAEESLVFLWNYFQDSGRWRGLTSDHNEDFDILYGNIRLKKIEKLNESEKIGFLIYITYRYRNNIFHGSKEFGVWHKYTEQIECCLKFMMKLIDCNDSHEIISK